MSSSTSSPHAPSNRFERPGLQESDVEHRCDDDNDDDEENRQSSLRANEETAKIYCIQCNIFPYGFRSEHELKNHLDSFHNSPQRVWICFDPKLNATEGQHAVRALESCRRCKYLYQYDNYETAAIHLRREHFCSARGGGRRQDRVARDEAGRSRTARSQADVSSTTWLKSTGFILKFNIAPGDTIIDRGALRNEEDAYLSDYQLLEIQRTGDRNIYHSAPDDLEYWDPSDWLAQLGSKLLSPELACVEDTGARLEDDSELPLQSTLPTYEPPILDDFEGLNNIDLLDLQQLLDGLPRLPSYIEYGYDESDDEVHDAVDQLAKSASADEVSRPIGADWYKKREHDAESDEARLRYRLMHPLIPVSL